MCGDIAILPVCFVRFDVASSIFWSHGGALLAIFEFQGEGERQSDGVFYYQDACLSDRVNQSCHAVATRHVKRLGDVDNCHWVISNYL